MDSIFFHCGQCNFMSASLTGFVEHHNEHIRIKPTDQQDGSKWRPENWVNPHLEHGNKTGCRAPESCEGCDHDTFEDGADAMLEALKKEGIRVSPCDRVHLEVNGKRRILGHGAGTLNDCVLVLIPDK